MKTVTGLLLATLATHPCNRAQATVLQWDADGVFVNGVNDGAGNWNTSLNRWNTLSANIAWDNTTGDIARFGNGGTGDTITLSGTIVAGGWSSPRLAPAATPSRGRC